MANDRRTGIVVIIIVILLLLFLLKSCGSGTSIFGNDGTEPADPALPDENWGAMPVFADADGNEVGEFNLNLQSTVVLPSGFPVCAAPDGCSNVFLMRFSLSATHVGVRPTTVRITGFRAFSDASGTEVPVPSTISQNMENWNCILNDAVELSSLNPTYQWDPYDCAGDGAWVDTVQFESLTQPIRFEFDFEGEYYDIFGISHTSTITRDVTIYFGEGTFEQGGFTASIGFGSEDFIDECTAGEKLDCEGSDIIGSTCEGLQQTCSAGLWPGCPYTLYQTWGIDNFEPDRIYTGSNEYTGSSNWKAICTDGVDNDCDGFTDKPLVDGSCPGGQCDFDCPECEVKFRTNAEFPTVADDTIDPNVGTYVNKWISVDRDGDGILESYGYTGEAVSTGTCDLVTYCSGAKLLTTTPLRSLPVGQYSTSQVVICEDYNNDGDCELMKFNPGASTRCKVGDLDYPACLKIRPTPPWNGNQEVCEDY